MNGSNVIPRRAESAWSALGAALEMAGPVPCQGRTAHLWLSEIREERQAAAFQCAGCSVVKACGQYADAAREKWHVWAGRDRTRQALPIREKERNAS